RCSNGVRSTAAARHSIQGLSATLVVIILACDSAPLAPTFWVRSAKSFGAFSLAYIGFVLPETALEGLLSYILGSAMSAFDPKRTFGDLIKTFQTEFRNQSQPRL
ncbi:MAG: hypothetical protein WCF56_15310, partial [Pseudolabrys sp.]